MATNSAALIVAAVIFAVFGLVLIYSGMAAFLSFKRDEIAIPAAMGWLFLSIAGLIILGLWLMSAL